MPGQPPSPPEEELTVLMVGDGDPLQEGVQAALERRHVVVERSAVVGVAQAAIALAPDLVLLVGDAAADGGTGVLGRLSASPLAAVLPVVLLADQDGVSDRVKAFRFGATAVVPRSASVDAIATKVTELVGEIPERAVQTTGEIGEATLAEFTEMLSKELRNGILSIKGRGADDETQVRLVLGEGRAVANAVESFVARVKPLIHKAEVVRYEFHEHAGGTLELLNGDSDIPEIQAGASVAGMRVLLADDDVARADAVGQELRTRGANVVITDTQGSRIERARSLDPAVLIVGARAIEGRGYKLVRRLREDVRLRWAYLLVVAWDEVWSPEAPGPVVESLVARVARLGETERSLRDKARTGEPFDTRIEATGPARLLRTLADGQQSLRATVQNRRAHIQVDLSEGLIAGASCTMLEGDERLRGSLALAALLQTATGRVRVEPVQSPADANIMAPIDAALASALAEVAPLRPSEVVHPEPLGNDADRVGSARLVAPAGDPAALPDVGSVPSPRAGTTHHGYALPKPPLRRREPMTPIHTKAPESKGSKGPTMPRPVSPGALAPARGAAPSIPPAPRKAKAAAEEKRKREPTLVGMPVASGRARPGTASSPEPVSAEAMGVDLAAPDVTATSGKNGSSATPSPSHVAPPPAVPIPAVSLTRTPSALPERPPSIPPQFSVPRHDEIPDVDDEKTTPGTAALLDPILAMAASGNDPSDTLPTAMPIDMAMSDAPWTPPGRPRRWGLWLTLGLLACAVGAAATFFLGRKPVPVADPDGHVAAPAPSSGPALPTVPREHTRADGPNADGAHTATRAPSTPPLAILDEPVEISPPPAPRSARRMARRQRIARSRIARRRGDRMFARERYREARQHYSNSLGWDASHADAWKGMALALHRLGEQDQSFDYLRKALELDPENAEYYLLLGDAFGSRDDNVAARAAWERALELDPRLRPARRRLNRLR